MRAAHTKRRIGAPGGFFAVEAAGLAWLQVPGGVRVARVNDYSATTLSIEWVPPAPATAPAATDFGARLAITHNAGASAFGVGPDGWVGDGFIGDAPLPLRPHPRWGEFYAEDRLLPYAMRARADGSLDPDDLTEIQRLADRLRAGDFDDDAPPARIHGDLWSGNVLYSPSGVVLIDPAAHGGHRLTDLAMLTLFGAPHLEQVLASYAAASALLPPDWRTLIPLHQVHPLLVHAVLFGGGYGRRAAHAARRYR